jgi:hypothetical protein
MFLYRTAISAALMLNYSLILSKRPLGFVSFMDFDEVEVSVVVYIALMNQKFCDVSRLDGWSSSHDSSLDVSSSPPTFPDVLCTYACVNTRLDASKSHKTVIAGKNSSDTTDKLCVTHCLCTYFTE